MSGNLPYQFARLNMAERLIVINVAVFIVTSLLTFLLGLGDGFLAWFQLPQDFFDFMLQPWSLITYSFLHSGFFHLFWNMLLLYFTGRIFLNLFNAQRLLNVYFMGVIAGGLLFMLAYNVFPVFSGIRTALIVASAGV
ncbi:MAG: rhomboid family intramembrane serine protease, partial [Flavobacteriaceae bacterium]